ncbi:DMT family transporter [Noviherbaspirillum pedocola]|uniref:DMT family transporter n=1 Tax=Noviherbaspirillum pedocola TaxID=2801341 RepID=A0A934W6R0_9BURK|nr:DMT family transporter [Noviherbaspirillum pedocola]MBK4736512.1 DMT family transporter [Noviherbaspirillum pedocola]
MQARLTPSTILMLTMPPLLWAGNAVVGRMMQGALPPMTMNFLRWTIAFALLLPLGGWALRRDSGMWQQWRRFALLGLFGIGAYNSLQYLALKTSSAINATLVGASMPVFMLALGALFFRTPVSARQVAGALLSILGVLTVLSRGEPRLLLALHLVPGDLLMLVATAIWAMYSWLLIRPIGAQKLRADWAAFMMAQLVFGLAWSGLFAGVEFAATDVHIRWSWRVLAALLYVGIGPAVIALRCWGAGVQRVGPNIAAFFSNLTPLFAALLSSALLGEPPHLYHALAFVLIVVGIVLSSRR